MESQQASGASPKRVIKRKPIIIAVIVLVIIVGTLLYLAVIKNDKPVDCAAEIKQAATALNKKDYSKAYDGLRQNENKCTGVSSKDDNATKLNYDSYLAVSAYQSGAKTQAKTYAQKAIKLNDQISVADRKKVSNSNGLMMDMFDIQSGNYYQMRTFDGK
jgi:lipopolysaccharide export LptBFGC system permease protein LptF